MSETYTNKIEQQPRWVYSRGSSLSNRKPSEFGYIREVKSCAEVASSVSFSFAARLL